MVYNNAAELFVIRQIILCQLERYLSLSRMFLAVDVKGLLSTSELFHVFKKQIPVKYKYNELGYLAEKVGEASIFKLGERFHCSLIPNISKVSARPNKTKEISLPKDSTCLYLKTAVNTFTVHIHSHLSFVFVSNGGFNTCNNFLMLFLRGKFDGRDAAVKRILPECFSFADREV